MSVRTATPADMDTLIALGRLMHAESPSFRGLGYDETKVQIALARAMQGGVVFVHLDANGGIDGGFVGVIVERWFSRDRMFSDLALFVRPDVRGGLAAARLLKAAIAWAREAGIEPEAVQFGISTGVHPEQTGALFERLGFERFGGLYRLKGY